MRPPRARLVAVDPGAVAADAYDLTEAVEAVATGPDGKARTYSWRAGRVVPADDLEAQALEELAVPAGVVRGRPGAAELAAGAHEGPEYAEAATAPAAATEVPVDAQQGDDEEEGT